MGSPPLAALDIKPAANPLDEYAKALSIQSMIQGQQLQRAQLEGEQQTQQQRSALFPGQLSAQQQELEQQKIATQKAQLDLQDRQGVSQALTDTYASAKTSDPDSKSISTTAPSADRFANFLDNIRDPKYKISAETQLGYMTKVNQLTQQYANTDKDVIAAQQAAQAQLAQHLGSVLDADPADRPTEWARQWNAVVANPTISKYAQNIPRDYPGDKAAQQIEQQLMTTADFNAYADRQAKLPGGSMNPVTQHIQEETDPKVIAAHAQQAAESQQMIQKALYGGSPLANVPPALAAPAAADATKVYQAYTQAQQAGNDLQSLVDLAKKGNKIAYAYSPVTGVLQINVAGQTKRINTTEIEQYGGAGSALDKIKGFIGKQVSGASIPDNILNDMAEVSKSVTSAASTKHQADISNLNTVYGSHFQPMPGSGTAGAPSAGSTVKLKAPDGTVRDVPADQADHYISKGAVKVP